MDPKFLREVQDAGWHIEQAGERQVVARCPAEGCGMRALLTSGAAVPEVDPDWTRNGVDLPLAGYEDFRRAIRERREKLGLTLNEVEEVVGVANYYFAKAEKDEPSKIPNLATAIAWAQALGYEIVLRPGQINDRLALRTLCESRSMVALRRSRTEKLRERRRAGDRPHAELANRR